MKLAMAVHPVGEGALAAAVAFDDWGAVEPLRTFTTKVARLEAKKPPRGEPDLRQLPALLQLLAEHRLEPDTVVIDGLVHLDADESAGLGRHLFDALGGRTAVIGIANPSAPAFPTQFELYRGDDDTARPLIVTCVGVDLGAAKVRLRGMHGKKRLPTLIKLAARLAKGAEG